MADRTSNEMFWAFVWWAVALVAALLVLSVLWLTVRDDPAAGIIFGGVTFIVVGLLLTYLGPGPAASSVRPETPEHHHPVHAAPAAPVPPAGPVALADPAAAAAPATAPIAPANPAPEAVASPAPAAGTPEPGTGISERVREAARAAGEAARAMAGQAEPASRPEALVAPLEGAPDDLKKIKGVGPKLEELLHTLGIFHFRQIAGWGRSEIAWMDSNLEGFQGRVTRDDWVGQSRLLAAGGETEFSQRVDKGEVY
jgi:predicted flap endonuclease-1-like 5' DNA nuclease